MSSRLELDELRERIGAGDVDTVLVAFPDLQGRRMGKRVTGHYFLDHVVDGEGIEACNYLLAVDVEMTPVPGYRFANWEQGYGDMKAVPDFATLRPVPWLEKTAIVLCDLVDEETATPVEVSPRRILQRQVERAAAAGYTVKGGSAARWLLCAPSSTKRLRHRSRCRRDGSSSVRSSVLRPPVTRSSAARSSSSSCSATRTSRRRQRPTPAWSLTRRLSRTTTCSRRPGTST